MAKRAWVSAHRARMAVKLGSIGPSLAVFQELTTIQPWVSAACWKSSATRRPCARASKA